MSSDQTITQWIAGLRDGDERAARAVWEAFFDRLRGYALRKLGDAPRRVRDEEDLALSAIQALCAGAMEGRFHKLDNRDDLWQVLVMITARKASNVRRQHLARGEAGESAVVSPDEGGLADVLAGPAPEFAESISTACEELLGVLDDKLREVALLKFAGHTNEEIAQLRGRSVKAVERYLQMIRLKWGAMSA